MPKDDNPVPRDPESFPAETSTFEISGPAGALEALAEVPEPDEARLGVAVLCHPHPQGGGTMHNKVVAMMSRALRELGLQTLRFNFRGVGGSEGEFGDAEGEVDDLMAVIAWVLKTLPGHELWMGGFSFGSYVAARAVAERELPVRQFIYVAPPIGRYEDYPELAVPDCPRLVIQGDEDDVVSATAVIEWVEDSENPPELVVMEGAGHFFHRRLMDLRGAVKANVRHHLPPLVRDGSAP
ncbi:MAG: alpha/beta fold hydrolase [Gammaproteobacteria bacterium]|nr:MAG: alpha/beta fold hydrolase [Gammaproteobacteria bacterium]